jgi:hypothetical protein
VEKKQNETIKREVGGRECQWFTPVILATWEAEMEGSQLEASPDKKFMRLHLHQQLARLRPIVPAVVGSIK